MSLAVSGSPDAARRPAVDEQRWMGCAARRTLLPESSSLCPLS
ncbi:MAG: hypothetical protein U1F25_20345 [Rubrivivax sp.]